MELVLPMYNVHPYFPSKVWAEKCTFYMAKYSNYLPKAHSPYHHTEVRTSPILEGHNSVHYSFLSQRANEIKNRIELHKDTLRGYSY